MKAHYTVLVDCPYRQRAERVNIGLVVFREDGVKVHLCDDLRKLKAINPRADLDIVRTQATLLENDLAEAGQLATRNVSDAMGLATQTLHRLGDGWQFEGAGTLAYDSEDDYLHRVRMTMDNLVRPSARRKELREPVSRLHMDLKRSFMLNGWLGKTVDHMIVTRYPIGPEVNAEFAVRNGKLNVLESIDLRTEYASKKRMETRSKVVTFDMARKKEKGIAGCYAVMAGETSKMADDTHELLSMYADHVFIWERRQDIDDLFDLLGKATGRPQIPMPPAP